MKFTPVFATLTLASVLQTSALAGESRNRPANDRQWLSIAQVAAKLEAAGYRQIEKIERESGGYEVRATNQSGERIKLYVNPQTAEVTNQHGKSRPSGLANDGSRPLAADCNQRRCRDDLPAKAASASSAVK